jgi:hypothetical protein
MCIFKLAQFSIESVATDKTWWHHYESELEKSSTVQTPAIKAQTMTDVTFIFTPFLLHILVLAV